MNNRYFAALLGGTMLLTTSCSDLDTNPSGSTMGDGQLNEVLSQDPSKLKSEVSGMYANMIDTELSYNGLVQLATLTLVMLLQC